MTYRICPTCDTKNDILEKHCLHCGQKLIEEDEEENVLDAYMISMMVKRPTG